MASVTVLQEGTGNTYSINVTLGEGVLNGTGSGSNQYYIRLTTSQRNAEGTPIVDSLITSFSSSDKFNVPINVALTEIMGQTLGSLLSSSSTSSASSRSSLSSLSSQSSASSTSSLSSNH